MLEEVLHIGLLRLGARLDLLLAGAEFVAPAREHLQLLVDVQGRGRTALAHPDHGVDLARVNRTATLELGVERLEHDRCAPPCIGAAHYGDLVAAPQDMNPELMFDLRQIAVEFTAEVDQQPIVGKFQKSLVQVFGTRRRGQGADAQASLL